MNGNKNSIAKGQKKVQKEGPFIPPMLDGIPQKIYKKLEPHIAKNFDDVNVIFEETPNQETVKIVLIKKKDAYNRQGKARLRSNSPPAIRISEAKCPTTCRKALGKTFLHVEISRKKPHTST